MKLLVLLSLLVVGANCDRRQGYGRPRPRPTPTPTTLPNSYGPPRPRPPPTPTNPPLPNSNGPPNDGLIPCSEGQLRNVDGSCADAKVIKNLFVYASQPEPPVPSGPPPQLPPPELHKNLLIIKSPSYLPGPDPIIVPPPRQENVVYILKKRQKQKQRVIKLPAQPAANPEVYFVHFDEEHDNPQLPGGIDLQTALGTAAQGGGSVEDSQEGSDDSYPRYRPSSLYEPPILNRQDPTNTASTPNLNGRPSYPGQYIVPRTFPEDSREESIPAPNYIPPWLIATQDTPSQNTPPQSIPSPRYRSPLNTSPQSTSQAIPPPPPEYNFPHYNPTQTNPPQSTSQTIPPPPPGYSFPHYNPTQTHRPQSTSPLQYLTPWVTSPQSGSRYGLGGATESGEVIPGTVVPRHRYTGPNQGSVLGGDDIYGGNSYESDERGISKISIAEGGFIGILEDSGNVGDNNGRYDSYTGGNGNTNYRGSRNLGLVIDDSAEDNIYSNEHGPSVDETGVTSNRNSYQLDSDQNVRYFG